MILYARVYSLRCVVASLRPRTTTAAPGRVLATRTDSKCTAGLAQTLFKSFCVNRFMVTRRVQENSDNPVLQTVCPRFAHSSVNCRSKRLEGVHVGEPPARVKLKVLRSISLHSLGPQLVHYWVQLENSVFGYSTCVPHTGITLNRF